MGIYCNWQEYDNQLKKFNDKCNERHANKQSKMICTYFKSFKNE